MDIADLPVLTESGDTIAAVLRDRDGQLWLTDSVNRICGTGISDYRPCHQGPAGDRTLRGGRLAPGAVAAEVIDDARATSRQSHECGLDRDHRLADPGADLPGLLPRR